MEDERRREASAGAGRGVAGSSVAFAAMGAELAGPGPITEAELRMDEAIYRAAEQCKSAEAEMKRHSAIADQMIASGAAEALIRDCESRCDATIERLIRLKTEIRASRAGTLKGLLFKLKHLRAEQGWSDTVDPWLAEPVEQAIRDLERMVGRAESRSSTDAGTVSRPPAK